MSQAQVPSRPTKKKSLRASEIPKLLKARANHVWNLVRGSDKGYCDDYKKSIETYAKDPRETIERPIFLAILVVVSISFALLVAHSQGIRKFTAWKAITWWEVIAIFDTAALTIYYAIDLWRDRGRLRLISGGVLNTLVGALLVLNAIFFYNAFARLLDIDASPSGINVVSTYEWYLGWLTASFVTFVMLDFLFAFLSQDFRKTRAYWILCVLVDGPPVFAFLIFRLYLDFSPAANTEIMSGAVVMQMLIADFLYLLVAGNFPAWLLANHLSQGCD
jgi:hypothetical protein